MLLSFGQNLRRQFIVTALAVLATVTVHAEIQFVGVMAGATHTYFAIRADETSPTRWLSLGDGVGGFTLASYEAKSTALTLRHDGEQLVLTLPGSHVQMAGDVVVDGLKKILNLPDAKELSDLFHPKLRPLIDFTSADHDSFRAMVLGATKIELRELPEVFLRKLDPALSEIEKVVGTKPKMGLWITSGRSFSVSFVVEEGGSWYLTPSVPKK